MNGPERLPIAEVERLSSRAPQGGPPGSLAPLGDGDTSLRTITRTIREERWLIAGVAALVVALAGAYLAIARPIYEARLLVQMQESRRMLAGLEELSQLLSDKTPADTEISIMRSQRVLGTVVDQLQLDMSAEPERSFGDAVLARVGLVRSGGVVRRATAADHRDRIKLAQLSVAPELEDDELVLTVQDGGKYTLVGEDGAPLVAGTVGNLATGSDAAHRVEILVSGLDAPTGSRFIVRKRSRSEVIDALEEKLRILETAKGTGIISVSLEDPDPVRAAEILKAFGSNYLRQNVEQKSAEAEQTLAFLNGQLPQLRGAVSQAENALRAFQSKKGTLSLSHEAESRLNQSVAVEQELSQLELQRAELQQRFTGRHPALVTLSEKIDQVRSRRSSVDTQLKELPGNELESARLQRDVKVASQVYDLLLNKAQELRILRSGIVGSVRIVDDATPPRRPARPKKGLVLALGGILGIGFGVAAAFARRALDEGADDPAQIEARLGLPVYVTIPHSDGEQRLHGRRTPAQVHALAVTSPEDVAVESLRSLRTALQFALVEAPTNVLCISSPSPSVGKSFIAVNLAYLLAAAGRRVLLIDADLRRGRIHRALRLPRSPGVSEVVSGSATIDAALRPSGFDRLDIVSSGRVPPNPAELLSSHRFEQFLTAAAARYDLVVVDTPPVLAVTDASLVARYSGVNLLVLRAGQHSFREIASALKQFQHAGLRVHGAILNDARFSREGVGRYGRYYDYRTQPD